MHSPLKSVWRWQMLLRLLTWLSVAILMHLHDVGAGIGLLSSIGCLGRLCNIEGLLLTGMLS